MAASPNLQEKLEQQERTIQTIRIELQQKIDAMDQLDHKWRLAVDEINMLQCETIRKVDDDYLVSQWKSLRYEIKNWAYQYFDGEYRARAWSHSMRDGGDEMNILARDYKAYLRSESHRPLLVQAFVWLILRNRVFSVSADSAPLIWAGKHYWLFSQFRSVMEPISSGERVPAESELRDYHAWRSQTAILLDRKACNDDVQKRQRPVVNHIKKVLCPVARIDNKDQQHQFENTLAMIISKAIRLDAEFYKQQAVIEPFCPNSVRNALYGYAPESRIFESDNDSYKLDEERLVHLIVTPGLLKRGNSNGERYHEFIVLAKCRVSQNPPRQSSSRSASMSRTSTAKSF